MSHTTNNAAAVAADDNNLSKEVAAKANLAEIFEKEMGQAPAKVELTPWVDVDNNDQKIVTVRLHPEKELTGDETALRRQAQRIAAMVEATGGAEERVRNAGISNHAINMHISGTLDTLAAMDTTQVQADQVKDADIATSLVFPVLQKIFPAIKAEEIEVSERDKEHVDITIKGPHRFTNRKAARTFTDALESGSGETVITNLNGAPVGPSSADDGKHIHIEYKGGLSDLIGADWNQIERNMSASQTKRTGRY